MKRTNSFSNDTTYQNKSDIDENKMFISMKETLHNPLQIIKSKELLNCVYKNKEEEKVPNNNQILELGKENQNMEQVPSSKEKELKSNNDNSLFFNENNSIGRNNFLLKYKIEEKEKSSSENIDYNTGPNTNQEDNCDKIRIYKNSNIIINTEPMKENQNNYSLREKNAMKEIKKLAQKIKNKINTFEICENTSKVSIEQTKMSSNNNIGNIFNLNPNNNNRINYQKLPFELINYSISDMSNNTKKNNNDDCLSNANTKANNTRIKLNKGNYENAQIFKDSLDNSKEKKSKKDNYNYRTNIRNSPDIKIHRKGGDIYTREMEYQRKKELKLEQIRKKEMEEEMSELQYRPKINNVSKKMVKNKTPIYKRLREIEAEKNNKLEKIKENITKNNPENKTNKNKQKFSEEDFKKWLISNENWNVKKIIKLNNMKNEAKTEEKMKDESYFHPKINKFSEKLFKINNELSSVPVSDRLCYKKEFNEENSHRKKNNEKLTFVPKINKYYPISDKYYEFMEMDQFEIYNKNLMNNNNA